LNGRVYPQFRIALTANEGAVMLEALSAYPFKDVYELIGSLHRQATELEEQGADCMAPQSFTFTREELSTAVRAMSEMPPERVRDVLESINRQLQAAARDNA